MKVAVLVLAVLGTALSASLETDIPEFRYPTIEPVGEPQDVEQNSGLRIINGQEAVPHSIPYQVYLIGRSLLRSWSCGGSLITSRTVLTAAHCIDGARTVTITLGGHDLRVASQGQITVNAASWKLHEAYNSRTIDNDVGVVILPNAISPTPTINYSRLPSLRDVGNNFVGRNARVSGWGLTSGGGSGSNVLRQVNNTVITNTECLAVFNVLKNEEICLSGAGGRSACQGDSGGPLVIDNIQVGIVSYGTETCAYGYPSVYARVTSFLNWIQINSDWRPS